MSETIETEYNKKKNTLSNIFGLHTFLSGAAGFEAPEMWRIKNKATEKK